MTEENVWSVKDLVSLTTDVQTETILYRGKDFTFQFCELEEQEEPKLKWLDENASEDRRAEWASKVGTERILLMIDKANEKNPKGATVSGKNWKTLPATLRYQVAAVILQVETQFKENFTIG
jgi:hypothetical protein|tara:strand:- start:1258 stop:1623 length:366 start_codon:yes stop_codon:yes gene_type:complete